MREVNHKAWAENAVSFIRLKGLEMEFTDWSGGWKAPVDDRHPTLEEAAKAAALLLRCNGWDLSQWTDDEWPIDAGNALRAIVNSSKALSQEETK